MFCISHYQDNEYNYGCLSKYNIVGANSLDINVDYCEPEIRSDIVMPEHKSVRLWGRVINHKGDPVENALVKLLGVECYDDQIYYRGIAHTISDYEGFYQFDLSDYEDKYSNYKLLVNKAVYDLEKVTPLESNNCDSLCDQNYCDDCSKYNISSFNSPNYYPRKFSTSYEIKNNYNCICKKNRNCKNRKICNKKHRKSITKS